MKKGMRFFPFALVALSALGCGKGDEPRGGAPPPPPPSAKPAACAGGGGKVADVQSAPFFPQRAGDLCVDPNGGDKACGESAPLPIDHICDLFDGECEIYKGFGVRRVVEVRYVDGGGTTASVNVYLSKFATTEGAYAMFTQRVVGDNDPADDATPKPTAGGGAAALGLGNAYLYRGQYLAELTYTNEAANEAQIRAAGERILPALVKEIGDKLPGEAALPKAAALLPTDERLPLGVRFVHKDVLGVAGVGPGALGYYKTGDKRYRVASLVRADADQAKDVIETLAKVAGAAKDKTLGDGAVRLSKTDAGSPTDWVFARVGSRVIGVGDEARVRRASASADDHAKVSLTKDEKVARLKKLLTP